MNIKRVGNMKKYLIKHKKNRVYLKYFKSIRFKHYVVDCNEATRFTKKEANQIIKRYKYPENWELVEKMSKRGEKA